MLQLTSGLPLAQWPVPSASSFTVVKLAPVTGVLEAFAAVAIPVIAGPTAKLVATRPTSTLLNAECMRSHPCSVDVSDAHVSAHMVKVYPADLRAWPVQTCQRSR